MNKIRGLEFITGLKNMVLTGDWDGAIFMWDILTRTLVYKYHCHSNDVYGIAVSDQFRYCFYSSSRDSTIRTHSLNNYINGLIISNTLSLIYKQNIEKIDNIEYNCSSLIDLLNTYICTPSNKSIVSIVNYKFNLEYIKDCHIQYYKINNDINKEILDKKLEFEMNKMINPHKNAILKELSED